MSWRRLGSILLVAFGLVTTACDAYPATTATGSTTTFCNQATAALRVTSASTDGFRYVQRLRAVHSEALASAERQRFLTEVALLDAAYAAFEKAQTSEGWSTAGVAEVVSDGCHRNEPAVSAVA
jgi:hypothetical protein